MSPVSDDIRVDGATDPLTDTAPRRALRPAVRPVSPGLLVLAVFGFLVLSVVYIESARLSAVAGRVVAELAFIIPIGMSVTGCAVAYTRSRGRERRFWLTGSALNAILLVSELYYLWWIVSVGKPPPGIYAPFQVLHTAGAAFFFLLLAAMSRPGQESMAQRFRRRFDAVGVAVVTYTAALPIVVEPMLAGVPGITPGQLLIADVYTSWGLLLIVATLWQLLRPGAIRRRGWERMIGVSLIIYAAGITAWPVWYAVSLTSAPSATERSLLDLVLVLGHYLFTIAAIQRVLRPSLAWPAHGTPAVGGTGPVLGFTYASVAANALALPAFVGLAALSPAGGFHMWAYATAAAVMCVLLIGRTVAAAIDSGRLFHGSVTDQVTGLHNHRYFHERLSVAHDLAERFGEPLALLLVDVDDFSNVNRRYGHAVGDGLLRDVAAALASVVRDPDVVCSLGADDFGVIARGVEPGDALAAALRIQEAAAGLRTPDGARASLSIGIACHPAHAGNTADLVRYAEGALLWVKSHGKDQALLYDPRTVSDLTVEDRIRSVEETTQLGTVRALAAAVEARQEGSRARSAEVAALSALLGRRLGLTEDRVRLLETAAYLRDVGMIALPDSILGKPGPLDDVETAEVRQHPVLAQQIVGATLPAIALPWIRNHHECWDGTGYPDGLRAIAIPLEARILGVCDAWSAMRAERPFAHARTPEDAVRELRACAGTQFDPSVVDVFLATIGETDGAASS